MSLKVQIKWNIVHLWWHCVWLEKYINENDEKYPKDVDYINENMVRSHYINVVH